MDEKTYIEALRRSKDARRKRLAALPVPEKVRIMVEMQKAVAPLLRRQGKNVRVWETE